MWARWSGQLVFVRCLPRRTAAPIVTTAKATPARTRRLLRGDPMVSLSVVRPSDLSHPIEKRPLAHDRRDFGRRGARLHPSLWGGWSPSRFSGNRDFRHDLLLVVRWVLAGTVERRDRARE